MNSGTFLGRQERYLLGYIADHKWAREGVTVPDLEHLKNVSELFTPNKLRRVLQSLGNKGMLRASMGRYWITEDGKVEAASPSTKAAAAYYANGPVKRRHGNRTQKPEKAQPLSSEDAVLALCTHALKSGELSHEVRLALLTLSQTQATVSIDSVVRKILDGEFDSHLEVVLEAAHSRKRKLHDKPTLIA